MFTAWHNHRQTRNDTALRRTFVETFIERVDSILGVEVLLITLQRYRNMSSEEPETREGA